MRYDIKNVQDLREAIESVDDDDRIAIHADNKIYIFIVHNRVIHLREILEEEKK